MEFETDPALVEAMRDLRAEGRTSVDILRYLDERGVTQIAAMDHFRVAFDLGASDVSPIGGWFPDGAGELDDEALNALLDPAIERGRATFLDLANAPRRIVVVGVSGNGKTTFGRELASRLEVPYVELDALYHLSGWREADPDDFRRSVEQAMSSDGWVLDGGYFGILGSLILERADTVVWLDQPLPLVLLRLVRRAVRDIVTKRDLFNGNRQTWRFAFFMRDSLVSYAVKAHFRRRRIWPELFAQQAHLRVVRLRSPRAVARWLETQDAAAQLSLASARGSRQGQSPTRR